MGPPDRPFPDTRPSVVRDALEGDALARERARAAIAAAYWEPIRGYLVRRWQVDPEDAADLTQEFFVTAIERDLLHRYDPTRARLRTYLRLCVDSHVRNSWKAAGRLKRAGGHAHVDVDAIAEVVPADEEALDAWFEQEWLRALFARAIAALEEECHRVGKEVAFGVFRRYDIEEVGHVPRSTYAELAAAFAIPVTQVTNYLAWTRRRLRQLVLDQLRAQCRTDDEFREEAQRVFGVDA